MRINTGPVGRGIVPDEAVVTWAVSDHDSETHNCSNFVFSYFISLYMLVLLFDDDAFRFEFDMPSDKIRESFPILPSHRVVLSMPQIRYS